MKNIAGISTILLCLVLLTVPAQATPLPPAWVSATLVHLEVDVACSPNCNPFVPRTTTGYLEQPSVGISEQVVVLPPIPDIVGQSILQESAALGILRGYAAAVATGLPGGGGSSSSEGWVEWGDTFTAFSSTLPVGTPVRFRGTLTLEGSGTLALEGIDTVPPMDLALGSLYLIEGGSYLNGGTQLGQLVFHQSDTFATTDFDVTLLVGQPTMLSAVLGVDAEIFFTATKGAQGTAIMDLGDTGFFTLVAENSDTGYTTASGHDYSRVPSSQVPEPSTALLLTAGLAGAAWIRRQRMRLGSANSHEKHSGRLPMLRH